MSGGTPIQGPWPARDPEGLPLANALELDQDSQQAELVEDDQHYEEWEEPRPHNFPRIIGATLLVLIAIAWVALVGWTQYVAFLPTTSILPLVAEIALQISPPLALIGLVWLLLIRTPQAESARITRTIDDLRAEEARFGLIIESFANRINQGRDSIIEQNDRLMELGHDAASRLTHIGETVRVEVEGIARHSSTLKASAAAARADMAVLLADLPKANVQTRQITTSLKEAGISAHEQAGALDAQLASLIVRGREAEEVAGGAAQKLAAHLARMEGVSETAGMRMADAAAEMTSAVDGALQRAADALSIAREGMETQGAAMLAMVEQGQAALARTGAESTDAMASRVEEITGRVDSMAARFAEQDGMSRDMLERISSEVAQIEDRIAALGHGTTRTTEQAIAALTSLGDRTQDMARSVDAGTQSADAMIARAETLLTALDATAREIDETLPAALARFNATADETHAKTKSIAPDFETLLTASDATLARLREADDLIKAQRASLDDHMAAASASLDESRTHADQLAQTLESFEDRARTLAEATGPQLIEALLRVKDTANQAADHARIAIADVIPQSAAALGEKAREALTKALTQQVEEQIGELTKLTERSVQAAQQASDRLMRQMMTVAETANELETRVHEAKEEVTRSNEGNFARTMSLLIESLNSTAIDVTKIFSNEVTDSSWAAYLRGDRGVFTRRAVRLLDAGEVREIARNYDEDMEFREQVNRYIHDFESMLRNILTTRDGGPLSVTLLSSDAGKLYVALAQGIERLRT